MAPATERRTRPAAALQPADTNQVRQGTAGVVRGLPLALLRSEGAALLAMAAVLYGRSGRSWWLFLALLAVPDLGLLGLLWSKRVGAVTYDLTHTYAPPAALGLVGILTGSGLAVALALVWFAHIGMDRALSLGLQYPDGSGCTHLRGPRRDRKGAARGPSDRPGSHAALVGRRVATMSPRFAYLYFMKDDPDRVRAVVPRHVAHWKDLRLPGYLGGPFEDRTGGLITFQAQDAEQAQRAVDADPFQQEGLLEAHWLKQWTPE